MGLEDDARALAKVNAEADVAEKVRMMEADARAAAALTAEAEQLRLLVTEFISSCQRRRVAMGELYPVEVYGGYVTPYEAAGVALTGPAAGTGWALAVAKHPDGSRAMAILADGRLAHCCASSGLVSSQRENRKFGFHNSSGGVAYLVERPWLPGSRPFSSSHLTAMREAMVGYLAEKPLA